MKPLNAEVAGRSRRERGQALVTFEKRIPGLSASALARFVCRAKRAIRLAGVVNVLVTSNRELRRLNRRFRGKDMPTDVLSFAPIPTHSDGLAGDVAISAEFAADNARHLGHTTAEEIKILVLHGILHLAGYDHDRDDGEMAAAEARLRRALDLPVGLIERNGNRLQGDKDLSARSTVGPQRSQRRTARRRVSRAFR
jgi:probable rRNA maturation factor